MQKTLLFLLLIIVGSTGSFAQNTHDDGELYCSKAKFYANYLKNSKTIVQTPLLFDYDVKFYFLDLNVHDNSVDVDGEVTCYAEVTAEELDTFAFELIDQLAITEVYINDVLHTVYRNNNECFVALSTPLSQGDMFTAKVVYGGTPPTGGFFAGISTAMDSWGKSVTWTLSEPFAAREWWPTKQVLEDKIDSVWVFLTTDADDMAGSNGLLTNVTPMPDNKLRYEWKSYYPIDFYLISFAVSQYQDYDVYAHPAAMGGDSLLIQNFIYDAPGCLDYYKDGIDETADFIELYSNLFGLYPFSQEKYGHCLTDLGGGMEHQTMTTIGGFSFSLVAHELGHMWFGDNVTCATWSDVWVNEGFATYCDYLATENLQGPAAAANKMNGIHTSVMSQPGGSVYVPEDDVTYNNIWRIFDNRLSYNKGAALLHMIRFELQDDDMFFNVLQTYEQQYAGSTATGLDFMNVLNSVSGMDFTDFFNEWYFGEGYPTYNIVWSQDEASTYMEVTQTVSMPSVTPVFKMLMAYKLSFNDGTDTTIYLQQTDNVNFFIVPINKQISSIQVDPDNWVVNKVGSITTGIGLGMNSARFSLGPNPVKDLLHVYFTKESQKGRTISIMDMNGNVVNKIRSGKMDVIFSTSELSNGIYFIKSADNGNKYISRFVKID